MAKTCLIAEHDPWDIQLLKFYIERLGFGVTHSFETQSALFLAQQSSPDVIILEAELPGAFGVPEVIRRLRADPTTHGTAIILVSGIDREGPLCDEAVGMETLRKPATYDGLRACLERAGVWEDKGESVDRQEECP